MHDRFARNVAQSLSAYLRTVTDISIVSVEQFAYAEFVMSLPDPTAYYAISLQPFEGLAALELTPAVAFTMIDRMLGGNGLAAGLTRALTEIEQNVVDAVVRLMLEQLSELWKPIGGVEFRIQARETRPQMLQISAPNEIIILMVFNVRVGESKGTMNVALPASHDRSGRQELHPGLAHAQRAVADATVRISPRTSGACRSRSPRCSTPR